MPDLSEKRQATMGRLCDLARNVEMKHRFRAWGLFAKPPPTSLAGSQGAVSEAAKPDEIDIKVWFIEGPVEAKVVEKRIPIRFKTVSPEIGIGE